MRDYDYDSGVEMWVSDFETRHGYEWAVLKVMVEIASGISPDRDTALMTAKSVFERRLGEFRVKV